jgi:hypothetical protein
MLTFTPANFVPGLAAAADEVAPGLEAAGTDAGADDGDGLAELVQAVMARIGMIAAATNRNRDTAEALLLTSSAHRPAY